MQSGPLMLDDEQRDELRIALHEQIERTQQALSLPFFREIPEMKERAERTIRVLSSVLAHPVIADSGQLQA